MTVTLQKVMLAFAFGNFRVKKNVMQPKILGERKFQSIKIKTALGFEFKEIFCVKIII